MHTAYSPEELFAEFGQIAWTDESIFCIDHMSYLLCISDFLSVKSPSSPQARSFWKFLIMILNLLMRTLSLALLHLSGICSDQSTESPVFVWVLNFHVRLSSLDGPFHKPEWTYFCEHRLYVCAWKTCPRVLRFCSEKDLHCIRVLHD